MDKIKTTHVGSLPRSKKLSEILFKKDKNELFDQGELDKIIEEDVNKIRQKYKMTIYLTFSITNKSKKLNSILILFINFFF